MKINTKKASGKVLILHKKKDSLKIKLGEIIKTSAPLIPIQKPKNIGSFDYKNYLNNIGVLHQLELKDSSFSTSPGTSINSFINKLKLNTIDKVEKSVFSEETKKLILALILGERSEVNRAWIDRYAKAGIVHILAISGLHIGLLMVLFSWIYKPLEYLPLGKYVRVSMIIFSLWGYALLTGGSPSVIRVVTMFSLFSIGNYINRSPPTIYLVILSFGTLVFINPLYLKQLGFQMSYLAVFGILCLYPLFMKLLQVKKGLLHRFWSMTAVTLSAQIAVAPITIYYFHQFPGLFLLTNWVVLPFLALFLYLGIGSIFPLQMNILPQTLISILDLMSSKLNYFVVWIVDQEDFFFDELKINIFQVGVIYTILIIVYMGIVNSNKKHLIGVFLITLSFQWGSYQINQENKNLTALWLLADYEKTVFVYKRGEKLTVFCSDSITKDDRILKDFKNQFPVKTISFEALKSHYVLEDKNLIIVDGNWSRNLKLKNKKLSLVLRNNTQVNLERLLQRNKIVEVIADASNYSNIKRRWKKTCDNYKVFFYDTQKIGPYLFASKSRNETF